MKTFKLFDKIQIALALVAGPCYVFSTLFELILTTNIASQLNAESTEEEIAELMTQSPLYLFYMIFFFAFIVGLTWFIARLITFKARKKEYEQKLAIKNLVNNNI